LRECHVEHVCSERKGLGRSLLDLEVGETPAQHVDELG
jgi:hypothetical protein